MTTICIMGKCSICGRDGLGDNPIFECSTIGHQINFCSDCVNPTKCEKCGSDKITPCPAKCGFYSCECGYDRESVRECK